ncbi:Hypothetical Protein sle_20780 [Streptomyces leeuwenhoekii]|uniref:Uncharacterized protein n=1 Tax=Streptomyces leeuwenhoekii TaxID=1437453 RepID=A0A0F7VNA1_STRLW|nr:Hypothetical Protein sle_20780 [Streptomyces leeuwenhoekii]
MGRCAYCNLNIKPGQVISKVGKERVYHLACLHKSRAKNTNHQAQHEVERAERVARADAAARESMRAQKRSDWRLGKSPSDYGRR